MTPDSLLAEQERRAKADALRDIAIERDRQRRLALEGLSNDLRAEFDALTPREQRALVAVGGSLADALGLYLDIKAALRNLR